MSISGPSKYLLKLLREGADFTLYCGRQNDNLSPVLAVAPSAEQPSPQSLRRLEHEYSLAAELDSGVSCVRSPAQSHSRCFLMICNG